MAESLAKLILRVNALTTRITTTEPATAALKTSPTSIESRLAALEAVPAPIPPVPVPVPEPTPEPGAVASLTLTVTALATTVGGTTQVNAVARDANGGPVPGVGVAWTSSNPAVATVNVDGVVSGVAAGTSTITGSSGGKTASTTVTVSASVPVPVPTPIPTPVPSGDQVAYPSPEVAFICGAQLRSGGSLWSFFDTNAIEKGLIHGEAYPGAQPYEDHYYDLTLALYIEWFRTGDARFQALARKVGDSWYASEWIRNFSNDYISPRGAGLSGLMLRALDGRPEMWPGLTKLALEHYNIWLGMRLANPVLHYGVRDGGFALLHVAQLAMVHPDATVRAEMQGYALAAARDYYARLQKADGGWYWDIEDGKGHVTAQPMMVGMLLEGLVATHQLTGDATVAQSITRAVDWMWDKGYDQSAVGNVAGLKWRSMRYFVIEGQPLSAGGSGELYGMLDGGVRDARQLNPEAIHAFGYAYLLTRDAKYRERGDEIFASTFGKGQGPGADAYYALGDYRAKEYNVSYRSGGRYLVWRQ